MRHSLLAAALLTALVAGCKADAPTSPAASPVTATAAASQADARFAELSKRWLEGWLPLNPVSATQIGDHRFDAELDDVSAAGRQRALDFSKKILAELDAIDAGTLSRENQVDAAILRNQLRGRHLVHRNPAGLGLGSAGLQLAGRWRDLQPDGARVRAAAGAPEVGDRAHGEAAGAVRADAREDRPGAGAEDPCRDRRQAEPGLLSLVDTFITPNADKLQGDDRTRLDAAVAGLRKAVAEHQAWLDKTLVPNAKGDFRIGQKLYDEKLQFALTVRCTRAEIRQRAEAELERVRGEMYAVARTVLKDKPGAPEMPDEARPKTSSRRRSRPRSSWPMPTPGARQGGGVRHPDHQGSPPTSCARRTSSRCRTIRSRSS